MITLQNNFILSIKLSFFHKLTDLFKRRNSFILKFIRILLKSLFENFIFQKFTYFTICNFALKTEIILNCIRDSDSRKLKSIYIGLEINDITKYLFNLILFGLVELDFACKNGS